MKRKYFETQKIDHIDYYNGHSIADPYQWLENPDSDETKIWVTNQIEMTQNYLSQIASRKKVFDRMNDLYNYPKYGCPSKHGDNYFFDLNNGLENQSITYMHRSLICDPTIFF